MKSLSYLNGIGSTSVTVTDQRPAGVRFDRNAPLLPIEQVFTISSITKTVNPGINILEIINPSIANVRYRVTINTSGSPALTGSTISWASLPSGVTLSTVGNVYTLSGIDTVAKWDAVKSFVWNLPSNYASSPCWFLDVAILYYDGATSQETVKSWLAYDSRFYYVAKLQSAFTFSPELLKSRNLNSNSFSTFTMTANVRRVRTPSANLNSVATMTTIGQIPYLCVLNSKFTLSASPTTIKKATVPLTSKFTTYCLLNLLVSKMISRTYNANNQNVLFSSPTSTVPQIGDPNPNTSSTFSIILTSSLGTFSYNPISADIPAPVSPFTVSGTLTEINSILYRIYFYPTPGSFASGTFTYEQQKDGSTQIIKTITHTGIDARYNDGARKQIVKITSSTAWTPPIDTLNYSLFNVLLVGGGGGGSSTGGTIASPNPHAGSGGGAGKVLESFNQSITNQTYNIVVGNGGAGGTNTFGGNGEPTTGFGLTANAGQGGQVSPLKGGTSGNGFAGGTGQTGANAHGGGGGGATSVGTDYTLNGSSYYGGNGGTGQSSTIDPGFRYGGGGGGVIHDFYLGGGLGTDGGGNGAEFDSYGLDATPNTGSGGGGGDGSAYTSIKSGGDGASGIVVVQAYSKLPSNVFINGGQQVTTTTVVIPSTVKVGDVVILFDTSTSVTDTIPTGWTSISGVTTTGIRTNISYKIVTAGMAGSTITGMAGTTRKVLLVYSANDTTAISPINSVSVSSVNSQATSVAPTNQTISMASQTGVIVGFAVYASTGSITTRGWTGSSPGEYNSVSTSGIYVKEIRYGFTATKANATISMSDGGTNTLQSFYITLN